MGYGLKRGMMWAGVMDDHIPTGTDSSDQYAPMTIALFPSKREAEKYYECVVQVDVDVMLRVNVAAKS